MFLNEFLVLFGGMLTLVFALFVTAIPCEKRT